MVPITGFAKNSADGTQHLELRQKPRPRALHDDGVDYHMNNVVAQRDHCEASWATAARQRS